MYGKSKDKSQFDFVSNGQGRAILLDFWSFCQHVTLEAVESSVFVLLILVYPMQAYCFFPGGK
jgi:hypothetical protein